MSVPARTHYAPERGFPHMRLTINWANKQQTLSYMRAFAGPRASKPLQESVGKAAIRVQAAMRDNMEAMVYSQPQSATGYMRTRTLYRATHAARPSNNHSGDEARAGAGEDLAAHDPMQVVEMRGGTIASHIGVWISYAEHVHEGINQPGPRPFMRNLEKSATDILNEEVTQAIMVMAQRR